MEFSSKTVITGIVLPNSWDETGRIIGVSLYTNDEKVYTLEHNSIAEELMNCMHQSVKVNGKIRQYLDGSKPIVADNYMR